jgi:hypothetical protein
VTLVVPWGGFAYIDGFPSERGPDIVLMHLAPIHGRGHDWLHTCRTAGTTPLLWSIANSAVDLLHSCLLAEPLCRNASWTFACFTVDV